MLLVRQFLSERQAPPQKRLRLRRVTGTDEAAERVEHKGLPPLIPEYLFERQAPPQERFRLRRVTGTDEAAELVQRPGETATQKRGSGEAR
jgi:hypothetical protein